MTLQINIKNNEAHRMAHELSRLTGENLTQAITAAISERLERARMQASIDRRGIGDKLRALADECAKLPVLDDCHPNDILYDEHGLAKPRNEI